MSSTMRETARSPVEASINGIVRRMVSLPRNILGGFSRVMGGGRRRNQTTQSNYQFQVLPDPPNVPEEWSFLASFQNQYGSIHPFFYACRFVEAMKLADDDHKFLFLYLHSPDHPFTSSFCEGTLCSELVVQFLDANFICWGALANRGEGQQMATTLRPTSFPFCAVIAPAPGESMTVLQQIEWPLSPGELVEILQRTLEEQGSAFGSSRAEREEKIRADRMLREEQDRAYHAALQKDKEKERLKNLPAESSKKLNDERCRQNPSKKEQGRVKDPTLTTETPGKELASRGKDPQANSQVHNYRLIESFPRREYGIDEMDKTLKEAGLHPRASLFLECQ